MARLSQAAAEGNVLARRLVERDEEIVWRDAAAETNAVVEAFNNPSLFSLGRPEMNVISNTI